MQLQFSHVMFYVKDMDRAVRWYQQSLGFDIKYLAPPHYASLWQETMKFRIDLHPDPQGVNVGQGPMTYFVTDDLDGAVTFLRSRGISVSDPRQRGDSPRFTEFGDSEGNPLGLYESRSEQQK